MNAKTRKSAEPGDGGIPSATGTYVYDERLGRVVRVSGRIPKVSAHGAKGGDGSPEGPGGVGPCGRTECGGGSCAASDSGEGLGDFN